MTSGKKILISGLKPTGRPHIGNYFGAMKQFVDLQSDYNSLIFIADLHALTSVANKQELAQSTLDVAIDYLAIGLDPKKALIFKQSDTPQVAELAWVFNCLTTMPYLMRAHAFKDAEAKNKDINVGIFQYPLLMAADILLNNADVVPVGMDQEQHLEIARDTARAFNRAYGETFKEPKALILEDVKTVPGTDGQKMSKSYDNTIPLFAIKEEIEKAVMSIPTDSKGIDEPKNPEQDKIFALHKLFASGMPLDEIRARYEKGGIGYKESKEILIRNIESFAAPLREKREKIAQDKEYVVDLLSENGKRAFERVEEKMKEVREKVGLTLS
ncbi:MAG: tryptophan--tRNA ligase [Patescibacteria group bacterium]|nr:tryptophan--tRNA ligase [bacterium]MDZ4240947.1 tryptophan--tRNA ligase [Patescibacteria group bacterium]